MPFVEELVAHSRSVDEICKEIGADKLIYQDLDDLISAVKEGNPEIQDFDTSCFSGKYVTKGVDDEFLAELSITRIKADL